MCDKDYVIIIGSINMDVAGYSACAINYADSNPGKITWTPGGVGRNIAQNLAMLGKKVKLISVAGDDFNGRSLVQQTKSFGVDTECCVYCQGENTSSYLSLLDNSGEMLVAINDMQILQCITPAFLSQFQQVIQRAALIIADCNISEASLNWITSHAAATPVFVDPVSAYKCIKIKSCLPYIHTLKPNRMEAETLSGIPLTSTADVVKVAQWFHDQGLARLVLSMGGDGVYYSEYHGEAGWSKPVKTQVVNVTGAGDAMMAGLAYCWLEQFSFSAAVQFAQGCSAMALASEYTNNPYLSVNHVKELLENNHG